jgi:hypothetical protein
VIAARVRGQLASAFQEPPAPPEGTERPADFPAHRARTEGAANLIVANDADILEDRFWVRVQDFFGQQVTTPFSDNGSFLINLADTMAGGEALVSLRSRGESLRPFELVEGIRREAEAQYRQTERGLQERLEATERRLRELRQGPGGHRAQRGRHRRHHARAAGRDRPRAGGDPPHPGELAAGAARAPPRHRGAGDRAAAAETSRSVPSPADAASALGLGVVRGRARGGGGKRMTRAACFLGGARRDGRRRVLLTPDASRPPPPRRSPSRPAARLRRRADRGGADDGTLWVAAPRPTLGAARRPPPGRPERCGAAGRLTELRLTEPRTANPEMLERLGVEDPQRPGATSALLPRARCARARRWRSWWSGRRRMRVQANVPETVYVRRPGETQAWLAEGRIPSTPTQPLDRPRHRQHPARAGAGGGGGAHWRGAAAAAARHDTDSPLAVVEPEEVPALDEISLDEVARAFEFLTFLDVRRAPRSRASASAKAASR